jgi:hypothetical protein
MKKVLKLRTLIKLRRNWRKLRTNWRNVYISVKITPKMRVIYAKKSFVPLGLAGRRMAFCLVFLTREPSYTSCAIFCQELLTFGSK